MKPSLTTNLLSKPQPRTVFQSTHINRNPWLEPLTLRLNPKPEIAGAHIITVYANITDLNTNPKPYKLNPNPKPYSLNPKP